MKRKIFVFLIVCGMLTATFTGCKKAEQIVRATPETAGTSENAEVQEEKKPVSLSEKR